MAENHMGPRKVTRDGREEVAWGDEDLRECLLRGLKEEFGLHEYDLAEVVLLGFFVEAPFASVIALFWAHTSLPFDTVRFRMRQRYDPQQNLAVPLEANVVAREPLTTANLARLVMAPAYAARRMGGTYEARRDGEGRDFFVVGNRTGPKGFHPATSGRLLQYLLVDHHRHPKEAIVDAFKGEFANLGMPLP